MRKTLAAVSVGLLLVAGQAAAAGGNTAGALVTDRVGTSAEPDHIVWFPTDARPIFIVMGALGAWAVYAINEDGSEECLSGC